MDDLAALAERAKQTAARTQASFASLSDETDKLLLESSSSRRQDSAAATDALAKLRETVSAKVDLARKAAVADGETGDAWLAASREAEWYQGARASQDLENGSPVSPDGGAEAEETAEDPWERIQYLEECLFKHTLAANVAKVAGAIVHTAKNLSEHDKDELALKVTTMLCRGPNAQVARPPNMASPMTPPKATLAQPGPGDSQQAPQPPPWRHESPPVPPPPPAPKPPTYPPPGLGGQEQVPLTSRAASKAPPQPPHPKAVWRERPGNPNGGRWGSRGGVRSKWFLQEHIMRTQKNQAVYHEWLKNNPKPRSAGARERPQASDWQPSDGHYSSGNELDWGSAGQSSTRRRTADDGGWIGHGGYIG